MPDQNTTTTGPKAADLLAVARDALVSDNTVAALTWKYHGQMPIDQEFKGDEEQEDSAAIRKARDRARTDLRDLAKNLGDGGQGEAASDDWPEQVRRTFHDTLDALTRARQLEPADDGQPTLHAADVQAAIAITACCYEPATSTQPVPSCLSEEGVKAVADLLKAAEILCLSHAAYEEIAPDELYADTLEREGLLICGTDRTGDGYTDITSEGYAFLSDVFERARIEKWPDEFAASLSASSDTGGAGEREALKLIAQSAWIDETVEDCLRACQNIARKALASQPCSTCDETGWLCAECEKPEARCTCGCFGSSANGCTDCWRVRVAADAEPCKRCKGQRRIIADSLAFSLSGKTEPCPDCTSPQQPVPDSGERELDEPDEHGVTPMDEAIVEDMASAHCGYCEGTGRRTVAGRVGINERCPRCNGTGKQPDPPGEGESDGKYCDDHSEWSKRKVI